MIGGSLRSSNHKLLSPKTTHRQTRPVSCECVLGSGDIYLENLRGGAGGGGAFPFYRLLFIVMCDHKTAAVRARSLLSTILMLVIYLGYLVIVRYSDLGLEDPTPHERCS